MGRAYFGRLSDAIKDAKWQLKKYGRLVRTQKWQALDVENSQHGKMFELFDYSFSAKIPQTMDELIIQTQPNLPWAENHFQERVSGVPLNPGEEYKNWPFFQRQAENDRHRDDNGKHSHTYMERMWTYSIPGIRYGFGNLGDVVQMLSEDPSTRQAYLPIWFPEDTGAKHGERVPCSLGYHFLIRDGELHVTYDIRSCDLYRHFNDDIYMAARLGQWMVKELKYLHQTRGTFDDLKVGRLRMNIISLHIFQVEVGKLQKEVEKF